MSPRMIVIAGPPGGGKSSVFPVSSFGTAYFNADDRAAELSGGSYLGGPPILVFETEKGVVRFLADPPPTWFTAAYRVGGV